MTTPAAQWAWLARIRRPQGRRGEVFADLLTDFPEKFSERKRLWLLTAEESSAPAAHSPREVTLIAYWLHKGGVVLHFEGVDSISAAEGFAGLIVAIPLEQRAPLGEDEVYTADLAGCTLFDVSKGEPVAVGVIDDVDRTAGPVALLVVRNGSAEILVPFAKDFLRKMDLAGRRVEMALPEGLIELNG